MSVALSLSFPHAKVAPSLYDLGDLRAGTLEVLIASTAEQIDAAQALRYNVFYEEMGAKASPEVVATRRDVDRFDSVCDHLLVVEYQPEGDARIVGTYRLLRREAMEKVGQFYSQSEFDVSRLILFPHQILEVGRSCVDPAFRNRAVMQLLWRGIGAYILRFDIALLFGCASFHGVDPQAHALPLSYLHHYHLAPPELRPVALPDQYVDMNLMPKEQVDARVAFAELPALIKGYIRMNGFVGSGAVIDHQYNTTDVGIVVITDQLTDRYGKRYTQANRD